MYNVLDETVAGIKVVMWATFVYESFFGKVYITNIKYVNKLTHHKILTIHN
jgi:hypothetical protein